MLKWGFSFLKKGAIGRIDRRLGLVEAGSGIETGKQVEVMTLAVVVIGLQAGSQQPAQGQRHENINRPAQRCARKPLGATPATVSAWPLT